MNISVILKSKNIQNLYNYISNICTNNNEKLPLLTINALHNKSYLLCFIFNLINNIIRYSFIQFIKLN